MSSRRYRSLHFNLQEGDNVPYHREHRSKKGRHKKNESSLQFLRYKLKRKYGQDADQFDI